MTKTMQYVVFYGVFCLVMLGLHLYVFVRVRKLLDLSVAWPLAVALAVLCLSFPACTLLEKFSPGGLSRVAYTLASIWLGVFFLLFSLLIFYEPVRLLFHTDSRRMGILLLTVAGALSLYGLVNALFIQVRQITVPLKGLASPLKAVHLSDLHVGTIHNSGYLRRVVARTNALAPDIVCITGDMFDGIGPVTAHTVAPLKSLRAPAYFATGNHEKYSGIEKVAAILSGTGVTILRNRVVTVQGIQIAGVDNPVRENEKRNHVVGTLPINPQQPCLLLYHTPTGIEDARRAGVDLQLSGHTHAGQLVPFNLLTRLFYPYFSGLYRVGDFFLHVSPGTGTWGPPMRIGSRSEITCVNLVPG